MQQLQLTKFVLVWMVYLILAFLGVAFVHWVVVVVSTMADGGETNCLVLAFLGVAFVHWVVVVVSLQLEMVARQTAGFVLVWMA